MALKSWQTNKKNNAPQKKGHGKEKPTAKATANEKQGPGAAQDAEPRPGVDAAPAGVTPTPTVTEHAEPHTSEGLAGELHQPTETDADAVETQALPAEEVEIEPVATEADDTAPASEAEAATAATATAAQTEMDESAPARLDPAADEARAEAEVMAAPEETQVAGETQTPEKTRATEPAPAEPGLVLPGPPEPSPAEPAPAEPAPIGEAAVATAQPAAAAEPTPSVGAGAGNEPNPAPEKTQPRERDPRLPPAGTVLQRRDRHGNVRCECTVEQDGIRYAGKLYKSLSAAAIAATKDMGLKSKTQNGHTFWGVAKPAPPAKNLLESLERAWDRYCQHAETVAAQSGASEEERVRVRRAIEKHAETLAGLQVRVA